MASKDRVAYFYDTDIGSYYYGAGHPMKPQRMKMTHALVLGYDLYRHMDVFRPHRATDPELETFHEEDYVGFLSSISPDNPKQDWLQQLKRFNVGESTDCPIFDGLYEFQASCAGASIDGAMKLNHKDHDICINWSGGLHHAKRSEASGFCYINDIVLGILELLKYHSRVMYIDIDIHHGDGVEEAFYVTPRVMTVSFHKFGDFFPGTGDITDVGAQKGKYYSVNVPLNDGIDDNGFLALFKPIITKAVEVYQPGAIVLQCGADSLAGDRLGKFNLTIGGHADCIEHCKKFNIPLLVLGGGGYAIRNVARCWAYETAQCIGTADNLSPAIPTEVEFYEYFGPTYTLQLPPTGPQIPNLNPKDHIRKLRDKVLENLSTLEHAPATQMAYVPPDFFTSDGDDEKEETGKEEEDRKRGKYVASSELPPAATSRAEHAANRRGGGRIRAKDNAFELIPDEASEPV